MRVHNRVSGLDWGWRSWRFRIIGNSDKLGSFWVKMDAEKVGKRT